MNVAFDGALPVVGDSVPTDVWTKVGAAQKPIVTGAALLAILLVAVLTMRALRPVRPALDPAFDPALALAAGAPATGGVPALAAGEGAVRSDEHGPLLGAGDERQQILVAGPETTGEPIVIREIANPVRDQVVAIIEQRPEAASRVVRTWLKQD